MTNNRPIVRLSRHEREPRMHMCGDYSGFVIIAIIPGFALFRNRRRSVAGSGLQGPSIPGVITKVFRKASTSSSGRYRAGDMRECEVRAMARSFSFRSACR